MADTAARHFLPWVRQGAAAGITTPDSNSAAQPAEVSIPLAVQFDSFTVPARELRLYGPTDVTAIDPRQIVRIQPRHRTTNFESNFFPQIEFDRPDFPWLFTPAKAGANDRLRPWICLVVVRKQEGIAVVRSETSSLPVLEIQAAARPDLELPDLEESWAWAHGQATGALSDTSALVRNTIETSPARTVSRLICPRRLDPDTAYFACVVPTFEVGRKAGLGFPVTDLELSQLLPAWQAGQPDSGTLQLPVYYSWEFTTGAAGDFESLVRDLKPRPLPETVGTFPLDLSNPGFGLPQASAVVVPMKGVLKPPEPANAPQPQPPAILQAALAKILNAPADALATPLSTDPIVAPPIYGSPYPPRNRVNPGNSPPHWLDELNLDPRHRAAAAFGTRIVQQDQEHLMASAWQQVDAIEKANQEKRRRQLAVVNRESIFERHVSRFDQDPLLQITAPSLGKVAVGDPQGQRTLAWQMNGSAAPGFDSAVVRRIARPRGPINRRSLTAPLLQAQTRRIVKLLDLLPDVDRIIPPLPPRVKVGTMVTVRKVSEAAATPQIDAARFSAAAILAATRPILFSISETQGQRLEIRDPLFTKIEPRMLAEFRQAASAHLERVIRVRTIRRIDPRIPDAGLLRNRLQPKIKQTLILTAARSVSPEDAVLAHPQFPTPMSERLIELAPNFLLPGLEFVPANTVTLVQPNTRFIEAFMVGLNHEMGRELLWREYPTDQRGSYFRLFWDRRGAEQQQQMVPINGWNQPLGRNPSAAGSPDQLVLLVRGELFRRYPTAIIYAAKASGPISALKIGAEERYPLFRGFAAPDVTFFGFDLTETMARGTPPTDPGWFFVIQQQHGEPDFGFDMPANLVPQPAPVDDWNKLTWRHLVQSPAELQALTHVKLKPGTSPLPDTSKNPPGALWGKNSAHMARIALQKPVRIAILASQMLPPKV